jgi:hypothetical protein
MMGGKWSGWGGRREERLDGHSTTLFTTSPTVRVVLKLCGSSGNLNTLPRFAQFELMGDEIEIPKWANTPNAKTKKGN